jgi:hypothetical protein
VTFFKTIAELPRDIRGLAEEHLASGAFAIEALQKIAGCRFRDGAPTFHVRSESTDEYANDGNTRVAGTSFRLLWIWDLEHEAIKDAGRNEWHNWWHGSLCYAISTSMEVRIRDSDRRIGWQSSDLNVGRWPTDERDSWRLYCSTRDTKLCLTDENVALIVRKTREVLGHLDGLRDVMALRKLMGA